MRSKRRTFLKRAGATMLGVAATGGGTGLYALRVEPGWIDITSTTLHLPRLQPAFAGYRIVQLSDIHVDDTWMDKGRLEAIVALANRQKPDLIVITGDFVTHVLEKTKDTLSALQALQAPDGVFGVLGNHDHWSDPITVRKYIALFGIEELKDTIATVRRGDVSLHLVGMDDLWVSEYENVSSPWLHRAGLR